VTFDRAEVSVWVAETGKFVEQVARLVENLLR
jgi:hypothetical protein